MTIDVATDGSIATPAGAHPARRALYGAKELAPLVSPRSIAVVGASNRGGYGYQVLRAIQAGSFAGPLWAVHPAGEPVAGVSTVKSVSDLPGPVDLAVIGVRAERVPQVVEECVERNVGAVIINAAGFGETGTPEGARLQRDLEAAVAGSGLVICGPNCLGLWNFRKNLSLARRLQLVDDAGPIGIVSQSGGLGSFLFDVPSAGRWLFSYTLCAGNSIDVDVCDFVNYLVEDDQTRCIALVLEGIGDPGRLFEAARRARQAEKPIVAFKCGRTERGAAAALSHTGSLAGSRQLVDAAFRRAGIVTVDGYDDLIETAVFFARARRPRAGGVGVATTTGGFAVMACDAAEEAGVSLPPPSPQTVAALREALPGSTTVGNPADLAGGVGGAEKFSHALRVFAADPAYDVAVVPLGPTMEGVLDRVEQAARVAAEADSTICLYWVNPWLAGPAVARVVADGHLTLFRSLRRCFAAVAAWRWWHAHRPAGVGDAGPAATDAAAVRRILDEVASTTGAGPTGPYTTSETDAQRLCHAVGIRFPEQRLARHPDDAARAADELGRPVALKVVSPDVPHKTEAGAVRLGVSSATDAATAYDEIVANTLAYAPAARIDGVMVAEMVQGQALMVGARRDGAFGCVVVVGWGGTDVELFGPPVVEFAPVDEALAGEMIQRLPGLARLTGHRGAPPADLAALAAVVRQVSQLIVADERIAEIDLNPVMARPAGQGALPVDALVVVDPKPGPEER